ncbi:MAG TPA: glycosyltransferase family A protein [Clostridiales bacterium]|nr:glycosyltransferase family A protein [Clostridiales bacterium]HQP69219.1 glycosyltransferase family A protein [Clostridiales bacterium]
MNVSVIIPVYNGEETLKLCLDAVTSVNIPNGMEVEILLINDGSTDRTKEIASSYAGVKIFDLEKNSGRVVARETGARQAEYEDLLFVDARVEVATDILIKLVSLNYSPVIAGGLNDEKYKSEYETLFYLVRKKIYKPYYPQEKYSKELYIDEDNFFKAPKGTTCFFVKRDLFLRSLPESKAKDTSDDTKVMHSIVFKNKTRILRHTDVVIKYHQRTETNINSWIHHRGRIWADHYLSFVNRYSVLYALFNVLVLIFLIKNIFALLVFLFFLIIILSVYLAENIKDFFIVLKTVPILSILFYIGTLEKLFKRVIASFKKNQ